MLEPHAAILIPGRESHIARLRAFQHTDRESKARSLLLERHDKAVRRSSQREDVYSARQRQAFVSFPLQLKRAYTKDVWISSGYGFVLYVSPSL